jgi:hypothetical protein
VGNFAKELNFSVEAGCESQQYQSPFMLNTLSKGFEINHTPMKHALIQLQNSGLDNRVCFLAVQINMSIADRLPKDFSILAILRIHVVLDSAGSNNPKEREALSMRLIGLCG